MSALSTATVAGPASAAPPFAGPAVAGLGAGPGASVPRPGWAAVLGRHLARSRQALLRRLAGEIADVQDRCRPRENETDRRAGATVWPGAGQLPGRLDRELHLLAVRLTAAMDAMGRETCDQAVIAAFGPRPPAGQSRRVGRAVRAACATGPEETVLVTPTGRATTLRRVGARDARRPVAGPVFGPVARPVAGRAGGPVVRPVQVMLAGGCYVMWRERTDFHPAEADAWLRHALDSVAAELLSAVVARCHRVHEALTASIGEFAPDPT